MPKSEVALYAELFEKNRELNRYYLSNLKAADPYKQQEVGNLKFNSIYWLCAHLMWAEDNLIVRGTGGTSLAPAYVKHYKLASDGSLHEGHGDFKTLLADMKELHEKVMQYLLTLTSEQLDEDNPTKFSFGNGDTSKRMMVQHAIRHEGSHIGHFGWIAKMNGIKMI
jgi:uncharacterized damage-inducible protein DinB